MTDDKRPTGPHLRLVDGTPTVAGEPIPQATTPQDRAPPPPHGIGPYEQALTILAVAVTIGARAQYDTQLRVLQYCGFSRDQLQEMLDLVAGLTGSETNTATAEVMERYDVMLEDLPNS